MAEYRADPQQAIATEIINRLAILETKVDIALKLLTIITGGTSEAMADMVQREQHTKVLDLGP